MPSKASKTFWNMNTVALPDGTTDGNLYLYGIIASSSWFDDEVSPKQFLNDLQALGPVSRLNVHLFSDGGDVFAGTAIYAMLKQYDAPVHIHVEGIAASIATVIAMAGDRIYISKGAMMMIHNPSAMLLGMYDAANARRIGDELEKIREPILNAYMERTQKAREELIDLMDGETGKGTWFTADEAIAAGFADEYIPAEADHALEAVACIGPGIYRWKNHQIDLTPYGNAPEWQHARRMNTMAKPKAKRGKAARYANELTMVTCPVCGEEFEWDAAAGEEVPPTPEEEIPELDNPAIESTDQVVTIECPICGAEFEWDAAAEEPADPDEQLEDPVPEGDIQPEDHRKGAHQSYQRGVVAERQRIAALDAIAQAEPECTHIVAYAKEKGWTYTHACNAVFKHKARKNAENTGKANAFLNARAKEYQNSGAAGIGSLPNSGPHKQQSEVDKYASMIARGMNHK